MGYRWFDSQHKKPLFPFGYGLGCTDFSFTKLTVRTSRGGAVATFGVRNVGEREGAVVPQLYVSAPASAGEPPRQLKGFDKLTLQPGASRTVSIRLNKRAFSQWSTSRDTWVVRPGAYKILVGSSSRSLDLSRSVAMH